MRPKLLADASWSVLADPEWPGFSGHFPGNPMVPGAELIEWARDVAGQAGMATDHIVKARFLSPVRPGDRIRLHLVRSTVRFLRDDQVVAEVALS